MTLAVGVGVGVGVGAGVGGSGSISTDFAGENPGDGKREASSVQLYHLPRRIVIPAHQKRNPACASEQIARGEADAPATTAAAVVVIK